tara:strand:+ start:170 stop:502 length:333 start_codon:yes stop_codon:yes gene_type:complete
MKKKKVDLNYIVKIEKAIQKRWGEEAIENPASHWDDKKEKEYLEQLKEHIQNEGCVSSTEEHGGILVTSKLFNNRRIDRCPECDSFKLSKRDKVLVKKVGHCQRCEWKKN